MSFCNRSRAISRQIRHATRLNTPRVLARQFTPLLTTTTTRSSALPTFFAIHSQPFQAFSSATNTGQAGTEAASGSSSSDDAAEGEESSEKGKSMSKDSDEHDPPNVKKKVYDPGPDSPEESEKPMEFAEENTQIKNENPDDKAPMEEKNSRLEDPPKSKLGWWNAFKNTAKNFVHVGDDGDDDNYRNHDSAALDKLVEENQKLRQVGANLQEDLVRLRNRTEQEKKNIEKFACEKFAKELLIVQDNFTLALKNLSPATKSSIDNKEVLSVLEGVELTQKTMLKTFEKFDIQKICTKGTANFSCHEVMFTVKMQGKPENEIVEVFRQGYWIGDRVLRAAQVGVVKNS